MQGFRRRGKLIPEPAIWRYLSHVCAALQHMHANRIMHRGGALSQRPAGRVSRAGLAFSDVKPSNVFIARDNTAKLGDLGLARFFSPKSVVARSLGKYLIKSGAFFSHPADLCGCRLAGQ